MHSALGGAASAWDTELEVGTAGSVDARSDGVQGGQKSEQCIALEFIGVVALRYGLSHPGTVALGAPFGKPNDAR